MNKKIKDYGWIFIAIIFLIVPIFNYLQDKVNQTDSFFWNVLFYLIVMIFYALIIMVIIGIYDSMSGTFKNLFQKNSNSGENQNDNGDEPIEKKSDGKELENKDRID
ncbi:hypothetical protein EDC14_100715 [Hydrogenispora ethanolica]|uniref:Uncharacterized protein n=1 Tax=Hydrogenispora ethanolica TaxID=1082276 RepID=A0A4R1RXS4_HYDET|nr:hypothetical protein [Hydrogenispora ethanolica]TCL71553.1 hypothetical protein EDC14_100715 [Hydrogenispora ethanolica]